MLSQRSPETLLPMYDYWKLWVEDAQQIELILNNPLFEFEQTFSVRSGEIVAFPKIAKWKQWTIKQESPTLLKISGSIHKFWNGGTNENDFSCRNAVKAIDMFCKVFELAPSLAKVVNLEFAVNIKPEYLTRELLEQVICYNNKLPLRPYQGSFCFIEFRGSEDYFVKMYDKGEQTEAGNIFRFEIKGMNSRFLNFAKVKTLEDLKSIESFRLLGEKINQLFQNVVFKDDTICIETLSRSEQKNYLLMKDPNEWASCKDRKTTTHRNREARFKEIVQKHGARNIQQSLAKLVAQKVKELEENKSWLVFRSKYTRNINQVECSTLFVNRPMPQAQSSQLIYSGLNKRTKNKHYHRRKKHQTKETCTPCYPASFEVRKGLCLQFGRVKHALAARKFSQEKLKNRRTQSPTFPFPNKAPTPVYI